MRIALFSKGGWVEIQYQDENGKKRLIQLAILDMELLEVNKSS